MPSISVAVVIDAPVERVWETVAPVERHVDWMADAEAIRFVTEQHQGVGTRFVCDTKVGPIRLADSMEITEWEDGRVMGVRHQGLVGGVGRFTLEPALGGGTLFCWEEELTFPWWLGGPIGGAIAGPVVLRPLWRGNLERLKRIVEGTAVS